MVFILLLLLIVVLLLPPALFLLHYDLPYFIFSCFYCLLLSVKAPIFGFNILFCKALGAVFHVMKGAL